jgi:hypothetical protein
LDHQLNQLLHNKKNKKNIFEVNELKIKLPNDDIKYAAYSVEGNSMNAYVFPVS